MSEVSKNSRVIYLRRLPLSLPESKADADAKSEPEVKAYFDHAYRALGSYWPRDSQRPGTGLTLTEEDLLMPYVLDIQRDDRDFRSRCTDFFHAISIKIEPVNIHGDGGTKLEIGTENNDNPDLSKDNLPLNVVDYIKYRFAISHPKVAISHDLGKGNKLKEYYIHNPTDVMKGNVKKTDMKNEAMGAYLGIHDKLNVVKQYLTLLNVNPANHPGQESVKLRELVDINPTNFLKVHDDKDKNIKFMLNQLESAGVLEMVGTRYLFKDSKEQLGSSLQDAIAYFKDEVNSQQVVIFKGQIQDWQKKQKNPTLANIV